ncbi:hypothetical protein BH10ACI4_BH10ACI4_26070 [soil metagenome]
MSATTTPLPRPRTTRSHAKPILWATIALAGIFVLYLDIPLLHTPSPYRTQLIKDTFLLIPHAVCGSIATVLGPFLFSTRFRQRHLKRHRIMGRTYVICIAISAPIALMLQLHRHDSLAFANGVMSALWFLCTLAAFITARNRQLVAHRQWMIRSYIFTLNFIITRIPGPIPAFSHMSDAHFALMLLMLAGLYLFLPDLYFNWRELTQSRA